MRRTSPKVEQSIMHRILMGDAYKDIAADTGVAVSTIKKIKKRNYQAFWEKEAKDPDSTLFEEMRLIMARANFRLSYRVDHEGFEMPVKDLLAIVREMHRQTVINANLGRRATPVNSDTLKYL